MAACRLVGDNQRFGGA